MTTSASRQTLRALAAAAALVLTGCDRPGGQQPPSRPSQAAAIPMAEAAAVPAGLRAAPLEIDVCGQPQRYDRVPQRAITHDVNITEMFLFLGLGPRLVGYSGIPSRKEISPGDDPGSPRCPSCHRRT